MSPEETGGDGAPEPDDAPNGPPPDPLDRPWVHPSELHSFTSAPTAPPREPRPREWAIGIGSAVAAVLATILVLVAFGALGGRNRSPIPPPVVTNPGDVVDYAVAERVGTAVAASVVIVRAKTGETSKPVGSGVVVGSDRVITAAHNLADTNDLVVVTNSGSELTAKVVGADPQTDLALLSVAGGDLQLAQLGESSPPRVGQTVIAVGAGLKYPRVSINVVSARDTMVDAGTGVDVAGLLETGITVTAPMSGGALVDSDGNLVGILTRATSGSPDGLAVPVSMVRDVRDQLEGSGKVAHGWIGANCDEAPAERPQGGAVVRTVMPGSPADDAKLAPDDVVVRAAGRSVSGRPDLVAAIRSLRPQDQLELMYLRDGKPRTVTITVKAGDPALLAAYAPAMG